MTYHFGPFTLDVARRELTTEGGRVAIEPQVFDLLAFLVRARDRAVSRDDLLDAVWNGRIVSDATLASRINAARAAIGDTGAEQRLIRTLPRKGFRFVGEVRESGDGVTVPETHGAARASGGREGRRLPGVAVLPFVNMSGDPEQDYFADGMVEEITAALARSRGLFVIARNSAFSFRGRAIDVRQIGRELGVGYLVEGSVRRSRERVRIACQLVDATSGAHLWVERFDGDLADVFALQDRVAASVAAAIEPTLETAEIGRLRQDLPQRLDAYELLLRAHAFLADFTAPSMEAALACLGQALAAEPGSAPVQAALAYARAQCHFQGWTRQAEADRVDAVRLAWRAVEIAPNDAQVLWMAAFAIWNMDRSARERARDLFARSLMLNPNSAMALTLAGWIETICGHADEGRAMVSRARLLNPRDPRGWLMDGVTAIGALAGKDHAEAIRWAERALAQNRRFAVALRVLAIAQVELGRTDLARRAVADLLEIEPDLTVSGFLARIPMPVPALAKTYADGLLAAGLPA